MKEKWYRLDRKGRSVYGKLLVISLLYILPIIVANVRYNDDMARTLYGLTGWNGDGRPLGELLIKLLCGGEPIVDLAPLPLILSVAVLSYALVVYAGSCLDFISGEYGLVLLLATILTNPFAMSNLSYRFDCIIMFAALSIPFILYAVPDTVGGVKLFICAFVAGVAAMSLYQPVLGMCIVLFIAHLFFAVTGGKKASAGVWRMGGIGAGSIFYKLVVARHYVSPDDWRHEASGIVDIRFRSVKTVWDNMAACVRYIWDFFMQTSFLNRIVWAILLGLSVAVMLYAWFKADKRSRRHRVMGAVFIAVSPIFVFAATFLPLIVLEHMRLKSRVLISFGGFLFFLGILLFYALRRKTCAALLLVLCLVGQFTYMYAYGNALKCQNEYEEYMVYSVVHDLETINADGAYSEISFIGQMPRARQLTMTCNKYPFFQEIVPVYFGNDTWIGGAWVYHFMQNDLAIVGVSDDDRSFIDTAEAVLENSRYSCYTYGNKIIICFQ